MAVPLGVAGRRRPAALRGREARRRLAALRGQLARRRLAAGQERLAALREAAGAVLEVVLVKLAVQVDPPVRGLARARALLLEAGSRQAVLEPRVAFMLKGAPQWEATLLWAAALVA